MFRCCGPVTLIASLCFTALSAVAQTSSNGSRDATFAGNIPQPELVRSSQADPSVQSYDEENVVFNPAGADRSTPLALFFPGTNGKPEYARLLLRTIAQQGYRVIGLAYDDAPAVSQVCPRNPNPACSANFREVRTFGRGTGPVANPPQEAINARLISLLRYLDREHPEAGWGSYLTAEGRPAWNRMVVSGLSQGAGMAAFIAKFYQVDRVVLFSSPWDVTGPDSRPAPWLYRPSATPPERWWAERHARENTTELIAHAYAALRIPPEHILLFDLPLANPKPGAENPYHTSTTSNPGYAPLWKQMYGSAK